MCLGCWKVDSIHGRFAAHVQICGLYRDGSILARVKLNLTLVRLYLTRTESYEEVARANNNIH